jgi:hypothetical protein
MFFGMRVIVHYRLPRNRLLVNHLYLSIRRLIRHLHIFTLQTRSSWVYSIINMKTPYMPFLAFKPRTALALVLLAYGLGYAHIRPDIVLVHVLQAAINAVQSVESSNEQRN